MTMTRPMTTTMMMTGAAVADLNRPT